ncbi:MAG: hypothetical protein IPN29_18770 [Saprospiraceae bacterium]|nr:hypothetical protein [Saprospiraceae bacterium]
MDSFGVFTGKSLIILTLLYGFYHFYLASSPKFIWNRLALWAIMIASLCFPLLSIEVWELTSPLPTIKNVANPDLFSGTVANRHWVWPALMGLYLTGTLFFLSRTLVQFFSILRLASTAPAHVDGKYVIFQSASVFAPCSFFNWIFVKELSAIDAIILEHEKIHADQYHSLDLLASSVFKALLWVHPFAHMLCREMKTNHEYICDEAIAVQRGKQALSRLLMAQIPVDKQAELYNQFSSYLKNRVTMMLREKRLPFIPHRYAAYGLLLLGMLSLFSFETKHSYVPAKTETSGLDTIPPARKEKSMESVDTVISYDPLTNKEMTRVYKRPYKEAELVKLYPNAVEVIDTIITFDDQTGKETVQVVKSKMIEAYQLLINQELRQENPDYNKISDWMKKARVK